MRKIICIFFVLFTFSLNAYSTKKKKKESAKTETVKADRTFPSFLKMYRNYLRPNHLIYRSTSITINSIWKFPVVTSGGNLC